MWWLSGEASRGRRWEQIKFCGFKGAEWELTKQRWCLFSLWLVMGGCSQHKHMPSWLAHFLPHSTSLRRATQAQDTTAGPLCSLSLHEHIHAICMLRAPWWTRSLNACYQCTNIWEKRCSDIWDQRTERYCVSQTGLRKYRNLQSLTFSSGIISNLQHFTRVDTTEV